jgi:hypothetical protein
MSICTPHVFKPELVNAFRFVIEGDSQEVILGVDFSLKYQRHLLVIYNAKSKRIFATGGARNVIQNAPYASDLKNGDFFEIRVENIGNQTKISFLNNN